MVVHTFAAAGDQSREDRDHEPLNAPVSEGIDMADAQHHYDTVDTVDTSALRGGHGDGVAGGFQLIALPPDGAAGRWRDLGTFPDLDSALLARVEDVLEQLARNDGWLITCEHLVLAPAGAPGPRVAGHVTQLGADPGCDRIPEPHNALELRDWLLAASGLPSQPPGPA